VVLIHGLAVSHRYLMPLAARLTPRYPVRAVDLPGFGLSEGPRAVLDVPALADWLAEWMRVTGNAPAVLIANSFGTQIVADLAYRHPDLVRSLVLVGPTMDPSARSMTRQALRWLRGIPHEDPLQLPILLHDLADAGLYRAVHTLRLALRDPVEEKLPGVRAPVLVTRGEHEAVTPQAWAEQVARLLPHGELAVVPSSPHDAVYTAADQLAGIALPFLERTAAGPLLTGAGRGAHVRLRAGYFPVPEKGGTMTDGNQTYDAAEHETFGFIDDEQPNEEGLTDAILDAEGYQEADKPGMTPEEERRGASLEQQLAAEVPEDTGLERERDPGEPIPDEADPLQPVPDDGEPREPLPDESDPLQPIPGDPNDPDPVPPERDEAADPYAPDPTRPESGVPYGVDPFRPLPDEPVPPRP
jgi:pimeloyl-ACP methyl ester carboxylesterase